MRGETAFIRGLTTKEKWEIRRRIVELNLKSENTYWLRLMRADLARTPAESAAARVEDVAQLIAAGGWPEAPPRKGRAAAGAGGPAQTSRRHDLGRDVEEAGDE